jgi:hypothetical protein
VARIAPLVLGLVAALATLGTSAARAQTVTITRLFDAAGDPRLFAPTTPGFADGTVRWTTCSAGACAPAGAGQTLAAGPQPAGTTFAATVETHGAPLTAMSAVWRGQVRPITAPAWVGTPAHGASLTATPATWQGGWDDDTDVYTVAACRTSDPERCEVVAGGRSVTVGSGFAGCRLVAVDQRWPRGEGIALTSVQGSAPAEPGPTVAWSAPSTVPGTGCTLGRAVAFVQRAHRSRAGLRLGTVRCPASCSYRLVVKDRRGRTARTAQSVWGRGPLVLPAGARLATGRLRLTVDIGSLRRTGSTTLS